MKPVDQTKFGEEGNCLAACIASILELPIEEVPDANELHKNGMNWLIGLCNWLKQYNLWYMELKVDEYRQPIGVRAFWLPPTYHLINGDSPRNVSAGHSVVGYQGKIVHDPHPDKTGLTNITEYGLLLAIR